MKVLIGQNIFQTASSTVAGQDADVASLNTRTDKRNDVLVSHFTNLHNMEEFYQMSFIKWSQWSTLLHMYSAEHLLSGDFTS